MITSFKLFNEIEISKRVFENNIWNSHRNEYIPSVDPEEWEYRLGVKEVYHWTGYKSLDDILCEDRMVSYKYKYISFTVRKDFNFCNLPIRIVFDMNCLKGKWDLEPYNYYRENIEREVRINQMGIEDIKECINRVEIFEVMRDYNEDFIEYIENEYPNIKFVKMGNWNRYQDSVEKEVQTDGSIIKMKKESKEVEKELEHPYYIPSVLYHSTYKPYLKSIKEWGLNPEKVKR